MNIEYAKELAKSRMTPYDVGTIRHAAEWFLRGHAAGERLKREEAARLVTNNCPGDIGGDCTGSFEAMADTIRALTIKAEEK